MRFNSIVQGLSDSLNIKVSTNTTYKYDGPFIVNAYEYDGGGIYGSRFGKITTEHYTYEGLIMKSKGKYIPDGKGIITFNDGTQYSVNFYMGYLRGNYFIKFSPDRLFTNITDASLL